MDQFRILPHLFIVGILRQPHRVHDSVENGSVQTLDRIRQRLSGRFARAMDSLIGVGLFFLLILQDQSCPGVPAAVRKKNGADNLPFNQWFAGTSAQKQKASSIRPSLKQAFG